MTITLMLWHRMLDAPLLRPYCNHVIFFLLTYFCRVFCKPSPKKKMPCLPFGTKPDARFFSKCIWVVTQFTSETILV